jgi:hypothetical protein
VVIIHKEQSSILVTSADADLIKLFSIGTFIGSARHSPAKTGIDSFSHFKAEEEEFFVVVSMSGDPLVSVGPSIVDDDIFHPKNNTETRNRLGWEEVKV